MSKAVVFLADGFEECEGLLAVDLLRRAGCAVDTASISKQRQITSSHGVCLMADALAAEVDFSDVDMIVLPGGMPGTSHLAGSSVAAEQCRAKNATCHPLFEQQLTGAAVTHKGVTVDGNIITGRGLGSAIPFALELVKRLTDEATAEKIRAALCYNG